MVNNNIHNVVIVLPVPYDQLGQQFLLLSKTSGLAYPRPA